MRFNFQFICEGILSWLHIGSSAAHPLYSFCLIKIAPSVFDIHNQYAVREIIQLTLINTVIFYKLHED